MKVDMINMSAVPQNYVKNERPDFIKVDADFCVGLVLHASRDNEAEV